MNTMVSSSSHAPPHTFSAVHTVTGEPPASGTFITRFSERNASQRPSGLKNGLRALSVPGRTRLSMLSRFRTRSSVSFFSVMTA